MLVSVLALAYAASLFVLAVILQTIYRRYPAACPAPIAGIQLSAAQSILLLLAIFMTLLGLLLLPVGLGLLPFSPGAQLGLLMVFFALQMLIAGETPLGAFAQNTLMLVCRMIFASAGILSCLFPQAIVRPLKMMIGGLNLLNGILTLRRCHRPSAAPTDDTAPAVREAMKRLLRLQRLLGVLNVLFGTSMLLPGLVPTLVTGIILAANGIAMLMLVQLLAIHN